MTLEAEGNTTHIAPRIGASVGRAFAAAGIGRRIGYGGSGGASVFHGELAVALNRTEANRTLWCAIVRSQRQRGPKFDVLGQTFRVNDNIHEAGLSFGNGLGGTSDTPSSFILLGAVGFQRSYTSTFTVVGNESTQSSGVFAGAGISVVVKSWFTIGVASRYVLRNNVSNVMSVDASFGYF